MNNSILGIKDAQQGMTGRATMPEESVFVKAHGALSFSQDLARRVMKLETRLLGQRPPEGGEARVDNPAPSGTFNELRMHASQTYEDIAVAMDAITRIENQLP